MKKEVLFMDLLSPKGNVLVLIHYAKVYSKELNFDEDQIMKEMTASNYENLINVFQKYFNDKIILVNTPRINIDVSICNITNYIY